MPQMRMFVCFMKSTLDHINKFETSVNQFDHILMLKTSSFGVWLSIRGSSIVHLYDNCTFKCKFMFDIRTNEIQSLNKVS